MSIQATAHVCNLTEQQLSDCSLQMLYIYHTSNPPNLSLESPGDFYVPVPRGFSKLVN